MSKLLFLLFLLFGLILAIYIFQPLPAGDDLSKQNLTVEPVEETKKLEEKEENIIAPIKEFEIRITKKPFGIFITPQTSPIQPERFSGYHTGLDVEYEDVENKVAVLAITDGLVEYSGWVSGYGGIAAIRHTIRGKEYLVIYGHLNPASLIAKGKRVVKGEQIGVLGQGNSTETDGERKHLHFALYTGQDLNLAGYVQTQNQLSAWLDPKIIFSSF